MTTNLNKLSQMLGCILGLCLLFGCSESSVVKVTRHGGVSLDSSMVLAVGNISGEQEKDFRNELKRALRANVDLKVLSDAHGDAALTDSMYSVLAATMAQQRQSLVLITGRYKLDTYDEHMERTAPDNSKVKYIERTFTGRFEFNMSDLSNHTLSFARDIQASASEDKDPSWLLNAIVDAIITDPMNGRVRRMVIDNFMYELYPHEEVYNAKFFKDSEMPELESGIAHANLGRWDDAISLFASVAEKYPTHKNVHKAYYNLGIAYKWNFMFAEARQNLEKAYLLNNSSEYYDEIQDLAQFEQEYNMRQKEQSHPEN